MAVSRRPPTSAHCVTAGLGPRTLEPRFAQAVLDPLPVSRIAERLSELIHLEERIKAAQVGCCTFGMIEASGFAIRCCQRDVEGPVLRMTADRRFQDRDRVAVSFVEVVGKAK